MVLFIGVKIAFAGLDLAIGQNQPDVIRQPLSTASGGDSQWMLLTKDDKNEEVTRWLEKADQDDQAYWLERQEAGEYVLYLPMQDRVIGVDDITVTQESGEEDSKALVLRIRTPEGSEETEDGQILVLQDYYSTWEGEQVRKGTGSAALHCHRRRALLERGGLSHAEEPELSALRGRNAADQAGISPAG